MPDLFIRGLHLPKSLCGEETHVDIRIFSDGTVIMATGRPPYYKKFDAVPIPAGHGRLGDLDEMMEYIKTHDYELKSRMGCVGKGMFTYQIQEYANNHTIVPAEGGTEDGN